MASLQGAETDISLSTVDVDGATLMRAAAAAELAGFDAVWVYDHLSGAVLGGSSAHDVWGILAAVAHATDRVGQ